MEIYAMEFYVSPIRILPGTHITVEILREVVTNISVRKTRSEEFEGWVIFLSLLNDID